MNIKDIYKKAFKLPSRTGYGGFPTTCTDCGGYLIKNEDWDYMSEWWISYTCEDCSSKFRYMQSDMGQSLPQFEKYKSREDAERREDSMQRGR